MSAFADVVKKTGVDVLSGMADAYKAMKDEALAKMKVAFEPAFAHFFKKFPQVTAIVWTQYTPYFNDGDPCEFGVHTKYFTTDEKPDLETYPEDSEGTWFGEYITPHTAEHYEDVQRRHPNINCSKEIAKAKEFYAGNNQWVAEAQDELDKFSSIPEEVYQSLGEGRVVVTHNGIDVEEYDHE